MGPMIRESDESVRLSPIMKYSPAGIKHPPPAMAPQPGVAELGGLTDRVRATGLSVGLDVEGAAFPLGAAAELTVYRIVQEALTNTLRHAAAQHARVTISYDEPEVRIKVTDDGIPAVPSTQGHGIEGMRERVALHHGALHAGPADDRGWLVEATLRPKVNGTVPV